MRTDSQSPDLTNRRLLLPSLIERVVQHSDKDALDEFHNTRRPFRLGQGERLRFVEYVSALRDLQLTDRSSSPRLTEEALDRAHSLTVDRFLNLPDAESRENVTPLTNGNHHKTDCRLYFGAFLERFRTMEPVHAASDIERELLASRLLQSHVNRHFKLCVLEAQRSANDLVSRYEWKINGRSLYLWFPAEFPGHDRRAWLDAKVPDPDPCR
ncbi:MAG: hypothetical protein NTW86_24860, partial [Candidatus Sumerlaeota bacterium]|nr:hypothetical protein [Candidatus Sumerlaeota bacterium]